MSDAVLTRVVSDAGPLIHLDELGCLELLGDFPRIIVLESVWREVETHRPEALGHRGIQFEPLRAAAERDPAIEAIMVLFLLQQGEADALRIMRQRDGDLLLTDDTAARIAAHGLGMRVHGTIGILVRSIRREMRTTAEVVALLRSIPERSTLFIKRALLEEIIRQVEHQA